VIWRGVVALLDALKLEICDDFATFLLPFYQDFFALQVVVV
jgi:hypothetical protein